MRVFLAALFFCGTFAQASNTSQLLLKNANILDPTESAPRVGHVLLDGEKISQILQAVPADYSGRVLDLNGKWVLPGLRDFHVHAYGNRSPRGDFQHLGLEGSSRSMLYAGVTAFLDLFHDENMILDLRDQQRSGKLGAKGPLPDIFAAGPILTSTGGHGTEYGQFTRVINSPLQAELEIRALAYKKPDVIKIVYDHAATQFTTLTKETLKRALEVAREVGIKTVTHIGTWEDAEEAVDGGTSAITHTYSSPVPDSLIEKLKKKNVVYIPTLAVQMDLFNINQKPSLLDQPLLKEMVPDAFLTSYKEEKKFSPWVKSWMDWQRKGTATYQKNFLALAEAGVAVVAGTDVANLGTFQGYSLHRELELMVEAGVSNQFALQAATTNACAFIGRDCRIRPGAYADLIVVENSPLKSISNTQQIAHVIYRGTLVDRTQLKTQILAAPVMEAGKEIGGVAGPCIHH